MALVCYKCGKIIEKVGKIEIETDGSELTDKCGERHRYCAVIKYFCQKCAKEEEKEDEK